MRRRRAQWICVLSVLLLLLSACGRVDLEDLTPEAVKTEQAIAAVTATAVAEQQAEAGADFTGNADRGKVRYDVWCTGCHDGGMAEPILGNAYPLEEWLPFFREGNGTDHPTYNPVTDLTDENLNDIVTYIATAQ